MVDATPPTEIVVTAARAPEEAQDTPATVSVIDGAEVEHLGDALVPSLLRLVPSVSVASSGSAGSLTEVRIRGAENNHTLLFIDGIRANDPATGDQPRFELLNADLVSRIEVVRGPQSALWGSEAVGGVVAIDGVPAEDDRIAGQGELGSFRFQRASVSGSMSQASSNLAAAVGWQRAAGIDAFDGTGDRDGYRNLSGRFRGTLEAAPSIKLGVAAFALSGESEFDGFDPVTFLHADTLDSSRNRMMAARLWADFGEEGAAWSGHVGGSLLGSRNRNLFAGDEINRTSGRRASLDGQLERTFRTGTIDHRLIVAFDHNSEQFHARDTIYFGATNQDRSRTHNAMTGEWRTNAGPVVADLALRRDWFSRFDDATTVRASLLGKLGGGFAVAASYGEGIAQPTFFDLYGFFPSSFVGNPLLKPEKSHGSEVSVRYSRRNLAASITAYRQDLTDEIVDIFDPVTFISSTENRIEKSRRSGVETQVEWHQGDRVRLAATYAYLNATQPSDIGTRQERETRRQRLSGSVSADGRLNRITYGLSLAYAGERIDTDFESFPARRVRLGAYWLAGARVGFNVADGLELFARAANAFDAHYQDALGYRTEGRSIYAGIRLARGR